MRLIKHWTCKWWRLWSVQLNALGLLILGWVQIDPVGVLYVWNMMPEAVVGHLPARAVTWIGMALFALSMVARLVHQPTIQRKIEEKHGADEPA